ncbi:MAG: dTDP-4-dehydrorhamnose reductase [Candidatus Cyclobacteriaceae bacterium M3_2C_046]
MYKKFLILGSNGQLGTEYQQTFSKKNIDYLAPSEQKADITNREMLDQLVTSYNPEVIINCAAFNAVDKAEVDPAQAFRINAEAILNLTHICHQRKIFLVHYSSDYVFDGKKHHWYLESDQPHPLNQYGKSKWQGEKHIKAGLKNYLIFRLSWVIGPGQQNFLFKLSQWAASNPVLKISGDEVSVPTFTPTIVELTLLSLSQGLSGLFHLTNSDYASRYELARAYLKLKNLDNLVVPVPMSYFNMPAPRPLFSVMSNQQLAKTLNLEIPAWQQELETYAG